MQTVVCGALMATDVPTLESAGPIWKRPAVWRLLLVALFAEVGYAVMNISTMPIYLAADPGTPRWIAEGRGLGESVIGWIVVAFLLSEAVLKSPMGALADRIGPRKLMLIGPLITVFTSFLTILIPLNWGAAEVGLLILLRIGDGIGAAMLWPALFSRMGHVVDDDDRQSAMSLLNLCYLCGIAFALPIGGILNDLTGHRYSSLLLATVLFAALRYTNWYGDPSKWSEQNNPLFTFLSFINCTKYPPSLLYALMTIGPALILLAFLPDRWPRIWSPFLIFGRVPMFYYLLHVPLMHVMTMIYTYVRWRRVDWLFSMPGFFPKPETIPKDFGKSLLIGYALWITAVLILYPLCRWFAAVKERNQSAWLSYL